MSDKEKPGEGVQMTSPKGTRVTVAAEVAEGMTNKGKASFYAGYVDPRRSTEADASDMTGSETVVTLDAAERNVDAPAPVKATGSKTRNN